MSKSSRIEHRRDLGCQVTLLLLLLLMHHTRGCIGCCVVRAAPDSNGRAGQREDVDQHLHLTLVHGPDEAVVVQRVRHLKMHTQCGAQMTVCSYHSGMQVANIKGDSPV